MTTDREAFGVRLRVEREGRGITLKQIAASTKIKESFFAELERGDLSKWPQGIFRRAHLSAYSSAIGLPSQPTLTEFLQLFPEETSVEPPDPSKEGHGIAETHTEAANTPTPRAHSLGDAAWVASFDVAAICLASSATAGITGLSLPASVALTAILYIAVGSVWCGRTIGHYAQQRLGVLAQARNALPAVIAAMPDLRVVTPPVESLAFRVGDTTEDLRQERVSA